MRDILLLTIVGVFAPVALFRPVVGMLFFVWLGFFNPQSHAWGIARTLPLSQIIALATMAGLFLSKETKRFPVWRETLLLLGLWVGFGVSTFFALFPDRANSELISISKILLMVLLATTLINNESRLEVLVRVIALSLGFYGLKGGIFAFVSGGSYNVYGPEGSFLEANNSIGLALVMNIPLLYYLLKTETITWLRWLIKAMLFFSFPAVMCTYSRGAWLGLAMVTAMVFLKIRHKFLVVATAGMAAMVIASTVPELLPHRMFSRYDQLVEYEKDDSAESRFWNWEFCKRVGLARPLTGGGFKFSDFETYAAYYPEFLERWPGKEWTCHSSWLSVLGEHGVPTFMLWISLMACCLFSLRQLRRFGRTHPEMAWAEFYADSIQAALIAYMVIGTFLDAAYFDMFYYLVGMIVIAKEIIVVASRTVLSPSATAAVAGPVLSRPAMAMKK